jgi:hypothetical protein
VIRAAATEEGLRPIKAVLKSLRGPEFERQLELLSGFKENLQVALRRRFLPDEIDKYIFRDARGDLTLRFGDGDLKVQAKCWEFFFLSRTAGGLDPDPLAELQSRIAECFRFEVGDTSVCRMKLLTPVDFTPDEEAFYFEGSLELGGWCEMRFESVAAYGDARLLIVQFQPRVVRGKDIPPGKAKDPKQFVELLRKMRRR